MTVIKEKTVGSEHYKALVPVWRPVRIQHRNYALVLGLYKALG